VAESLFQLVELAVAIVAVSSFAVLVAAFGYASSIPVGSSLQRRFWWTTHPRRAGAIVSALVVVVLSIVWAPVLFLSAGPEPLEAFGPAAGSGSIYAGTDSSGQFVYVMAKDGVLEYTFNLGNTGKSRITVLEAASVEIWISDMAAGVALLPAEKAQDAVQATVPQTKPFSIDAGSSRPVTLVVRLGRCPAFASVPTLAPGTSPSADRARGVESYFSYGGSIAELSVTYAFTDGPNRTAALQLPSNLEVMGNDSTSCLNTSPSGS
jgi:hypothetical protein